MDLTLIASPLAVLARPWPLPADQPLLELINNDMILTSLQGLFDAEALGRLVQAGTPLTLPLPTGLFLPLPEFGRE